MWSLSHFLPVLAHPENPDLGEDKSHIDWHATLQVSGSIQRPWVSGSFVGLSHAQESKPVVLGFEDLEPFILCVWVFHFHACLCITCLPGARRGQKRGLAPLQLELIGSCGPPCECWKLKQCPLQEQWALWASEPSLQPTNPWCSRGSS